MGRASVFGKLNSLLKGGILLTFPFFFFFLKTKIKNKNTEEGKTIGPGITDKL